ncbi:endonuclease domain-containing 1 protein-like [Genypterus blacodes]|uniref:endonuclease domain-containing 1 protein-like n=1 Tax=Genypterus blacodes TaxID=154954 RepID=UPI003F76A94D
MSQRKMLQSATGALFLLLLWFGGPALGEVGSFSPCLNFFNERTPPQVIEGNPYVRICQRYKNQYYFASLCNRQHRTPLYSAYILSPTSARGERPPWMYEPQLANSRASREMSHVPEGCVDQNLEESQAVNQDYINSGYTRGHLNPAMHQNTPAARNATFTLTNIVPQRKGSNSGPWNILEHEVRGRAAFCTGQMYVVTGVMPYVSGNHWINNRVNVPEYIWSAYCCPSYTTSLPESERPFFPTYAAVGRNDALSGNEFAPMDRKALPTVRGYEVKRMSSQDLEVILRERLVTNQATNQSISLFHNKCQR